jgi:hypothetical protein
MTGHGAKFGRKKEEAIAALLTQRNVEGAARAAGIVTQTLVRWMKVPEFRTAYRQARREAFGHDCSITATLIFKLATQPITAPGLHW